MPRFSIKDLMLGITLVAFGLGIEFMLLSSPWPFLEGMPVLVKLLCGFALFGGGGAVIGAGALTPFHKQRIGARIGFVLGGCFLLFEALMGI